MASEPSRYPRLSRPYLGLNGAASLWVGDDHLLQVTGRAGWEQYRRWFFRDIQALIARQTAVRLIWNIVVGLGGWVIAFGAVLVGNTTSTSTGERTALIVIAAILGTIAVVFLLL